MPNAKKITKHEFVQHTSKYLKMSEKTGMIIITHHNKPALCLVPYKAKTIYDLKSLLSGCKIHGDLNDHVLPGYDTW